MRLKKLSGWLRINNEMKWVPDEQEGVRSYWRPKKEQKTNDESQDNLPDLKQVNNYDENLPSLKSDYDENLPSLKSDYEVDIQDERQFADESNDIDDEIMPYESSYDEYLDEYLAEYDEIQKLDAKELLEDIDYSVTQNPDDENAYTISLKLNIKGKKVPVQCDVLYEDSVIYTYFKNNDNLKDAIKFRKMKKNEDQQSYFDDAVAQVEEFYAKKENTTASLKNSRLKKLSFKK